MREAEVGLASKSAAWCGKSKSRGIALRSIKWDTTKNLEQGVRVPRTGILILMI